MSSTNAVNDDAEQRLWDEIRRTVAESIDARTILRCGSEATRIAQLYGDSGMSTSEIADALLRAAVAAGVPVQMTAPE